MDIFEAIRDRRSVRKYLDLPVEWDKVGSVLEAGSWKTESYLNFSS